MTPQQYAICARYAGDYLLCADDTAYAIGAGAELPDYECAVYIAIDMEGRVDYVGSVSRVGVRGAATRLREHLADNARLRAWNMLMLVPLHPATPREAVLRIEGRVGAHLGPSRNRRLPRLPKAL